MKRLYNILAVLVLPALFLAQACQKDETPPQLPKVITAAAANLTEISFQCGGDIKLEGSNAVTERGICWGLEPNPTIDGSKLAAGQGAGEFSLSIADLKSGTVYFFRAYATSASGTAYGDQRSVTTLGQLAYTLPMVERFTSNQFLPPFWSSIDHDGDGEDWYAYTSRFRGAISDSYNGDALTPYNFLISPKIALSGSQIKLEWNVGATSLGYPEEQYKVLISDTPFTAANCASVGTLLFEETLGDDAGRTLLPRSVSLDAYTGKDVYIAWVHYNCSDQDGLVLTDIRVGSAAQPAVVTAPSVGGLTAANISPESVDVSTVISLDGGVTVVRRGFCYAEGALPTIADAFVDIAVTAASAATPFNATLALEPGKSYSVRAYAVNAAGTSYSSEVQVVTPATVKTVLLSENFATDAAFAPGTAWTFIDKDEDGRGWVRYADDEDQCARSYSYQSSTVLFPENYMVTPAIALPDDAKIVELSFTVAASSGSYYEESYEVLLSTVPVTADNCREATVIKPLETLDEENGGWSFTGRKVDLTAFKGQTVYILFVHKECSDLVSFLMDDIEVASYK